MSVYFKRNSCDIMVSQRCCVLSNVIWTYFCHFLRCSRAKFIKKSWMCGRWSHNNFLHDHDTFYDAQPCCTKLYDKLLSVWTHLKGTRARNWNAMNYNSLYFNWTFVQEKSGRVKGTTCIDRHAKTNTSWNHARTFKAIQKSTRKFFEPDDCYRQFMDKGFRFWIKIPK